MSQTSLLQVYVCNDQQGSHLLPKNYLGVARHSGYFVERRHLAYFLVLGIEHSKLSNFVLFSSLDLFNSPGK
jgi:hypothetical protein